MPLINRSHSLRAFLLTLCLMVCLSPCLVWGDDLDSADSMDLVNAWQEQPLTTSRSPRPSSRIAENVTVITAGDIERLNAHTLADVLNTIPGIQLDYLRTPTSATFFNLLGALNTTVLVLVDGIRQNDYDQGIALPGLIPVQQIERIEIVKGSASTAWGSALGGVINIITKSPDPERKASGMVSGSIGSSLTTDTRGELTGTLDRFGYYLTAGNIRSDGLTPNTATNLNNFYGKLSYALPNNGSATVGIWHLNARPGLDEGDTAKWGFVHDNNEYRRTNGFLKFSQPLGNKLHLDIDGYVTNRDDHLKLGGGAPGAIVFFNDYANRDSTRGANARLNWGDSQRNLLVGVEYGHVSATASDLMSTDPPFSDLKFDQWALYANGSYSIGKLTILPGIRHDLTGLAGDYTSYSLGATYQLADETTLRAYAAQGFSLTNAANRSEKLQEIRTIQGGIETGALPYLWLKGTYFYNELRNSESAGPTPTHTNQNRQGFEVELRTTPLLGFSLSSGYSYLYAINSDTGERLRSDNSQSVPPHIVKQAIKYDNAELGLRGTLTGNYVWWNGAGNLPAMSDRGMIWDLHLNWKMFRDKDLSPELFFSGHNLFNGDQTTNTELYRTPSRWFEGGMRVRF